MDEIEVYTIRARGDDFPIMLTLVPENFAEISTLGGYKITALRSKYNEALKADQTIYFTFWKALM